MSKQGAQVKFGSVTIIGNQPSASLVKKNIERSTAALERVVKRLDRPGVDIRAKRMCRFSRSQKASPAYSFVGSMAGSIAGV